VASLRAEAHGIFNLGSGHSVSVADVVQLVQNAAGVSKPVVSADETRPGEIMDVIADTSHAAAEIGWRPRASLAEGIAAVIAAERAARG
jgi:nucleoside-diphosphate-sugar epimerase